MSGKSFVGKGEKKRKENSQEYNLHKFVRS